MTPLAVVLASVFMLPARGPAPEPNGSIVGDYVEARTAAVLAGGCIMASQAETVGREAVLAWRVERGAYGGVPLDGLAVVAVVAGDRNLGIRELGGDVARTETLLLVDGRASAAQREALAGLVRALAPGLVDRVVRIDAAPIAFVTDDTGTSVEAGDARLQVETTVGHDPSCGAMQWFHPLATGTRAAVGLTRLHAYAGSALGARWRQVDARSAFVGRFSY
jgi:hypothetical protein